MRSTRALRADAGCLSSANIVSNIGPEIRFPSSTLFSVKVMTSPARSMISGGAVESDKGIILSRDTPETVYKKAEDVNTLGLRLLPATLPSRVLATHSYKTQRLAIFSEVTRRLGKSRGRRSRYNLSSRIPNDEPGKP